MRGMGDPSETHVDHCGGISKGEHTSGGLWVYLHKELKTGGVGGGVEGSAYFQFYVLLVLIRHSESPLKPCVHFLSTL